MDREQSLRAGAIVRFATISRLDRGSTAADVESTLDTFFHTTVRTYKLPYRKASVANFEFCHCA